MFARTRPGAARFEVCIVSVKACDTQVLALVALICWSGPQMVSFKNFHVPWHGGGQLHHVSRLWVEVGVAMPRDAKSIQKRLEVLDIGRFSVHNRF